MNVSTRMVRIDSLPDLSRFVRREDSIRVHNTVHLLVGEESVEGELILYIIYHLAVSLQRVRMYLSHCTCVIFSLVSKQAELHF